MTRPRHRIQVLRQSDLAADARHDPQMIHSLDAHTQHDAPFRSVRPMLPEKPKTLFYLLRNVKHVVVWRAGSGTLLVSSRRGRRGECVASGRLEPTLGLQARRNV